MNSRAREALRRGRRDLHREMAVPAFYIAVPGAEPLDCTVRVSDVPGANGRPGGRDSGYAQQADAKQSVIFHTDDAPEFIRVHAIISIGEGEAYRIGVVHPAHGDTVTADVARLPADEAADLPAPGEL